MNEPVTPSPEGDRGRGYEATDVNVWYVMAFGLALALMVIAVLPLMISTFRDFERKAKATTWRAVRWPDHSNRRRRGWKPGPATRWPYACGKKQSC